MLGGTYNKSSSEYLTNINITHKQSACADVKKKSIRAPQHSIKSKNTSTVIVRMWDYVKLVTFFSFVLKLLQEHFSFVC